MSHSLKVKLTTEFIGTFILCLSICIVGVYGVVGEYTSIVVATTLMILIYAGGNISGAHYNPVISLVFYIRGYCEKRELLPYVITQITAGCCAALITKNFLFPNSLPQDSVDLGNEAILAELIFTFALAYVILIVATTKSIAGNLYYGFAISLVVFLGIILVGDISRASFNPAVTGSLILTGKLSITHSWMHILPQLSGSFLATIIYNLTILQE
jgi:aquaporin Z